MDVRVALVELERHLELLHALLLLADAREVRAVDETDHRVVVREADGTVEIAGKRVLRAGRLIGVELAAEIRHGDQRPRMIRRRTQRVVEVATDLSRVAAAQRLDVRREMRAFDDGKLVPARAVVERTVGVCELAAFLEGMRGVRTQRERDYHREAERRRSASAIRPRNKCIMERPNPSPTTLFARNLPT